MDRNDPVYGHDVLCTAPGLASRCRPCRKIREARRDEREKLAAEAAETHVHDTP